MTTPIPPAIAHGARNIWLATNLLLDLVCNECVYSNSHSGTKSKKKVYMIFKKKLTAIQERFPTDVVTNPGAKSAAYTLLSSIYTQYLPSLRDRKNKEMATFQSKLIESLFALDIILDDSSTQFSLAKYLREKQHNPIHVIEQSDAALALALIVLRTDEEEHHRRFLVKVFTNILATETRDLDTVEIPTEAEILEDSASS